MSLHAWLSADDLPAATIDLLFRIPADEAWKAQLRGALVPLMYAQNFEQFGDLTPDEMADTWRDYILDFFNEVQFMVPIGVVLEYAGVNLPAGFLWADGSLVSRSTYPALFAEIGSQFGANDGATNFKLPDRRGKVAIGAFPGSPFNWDVGDVGGEINHTLSVGELPTVTVVQNSHNHTQNSHNHTQNSHTHTVFGALNANTGTTRRQVSLTSGGDDAQTQATTPTNVATTPTNVATTPTNQAFGSNTPHNNLQPYLIENFIIRAL